MIPKFKSALETQRPTENSVEPLDQEQLGIYVETNQFIGDLVLIIKEKHVKSFWDGLDEVLFEKVHFSEEMIAEN